MEDTERL